MPKDNPVSDKYFKPNSKDIRPKRFNLAEEELKNGWAKPKGTTYNGRDFGFIEFLFITLATSAITLLGLHRGFFNYDAMSLLGIPGWVTVTSLLVLGEVIFYFVFLHGRVKKLNFIKETVPFKIISYVLGAISAIFAPITALLAGSLIPFWLNHVFGNFITKRNFDKRTEYYLPEKFVKEEFEEPKKVQQKVVPIRQPTKDIPQSPFGQPKIEVGPITDLDSLEVKLPDFSNIMRKLF